MKLYVLPPCRPQYNGGVERGNRTFREEFYAQKNKNCSHCLISKKSKCKIIIQFDTHLQKTVMKYNTYSVKVQIDVGKSRL